MPEAEEHAGPPDEDDGASLFEDPYPSHVDADPAVNTEKCTDVGVLDPYLLFAGTQFFVAHPF